MIMLLACMMVLSLTGCGEKPTPGIGKVGDQYCYTIVMSTAEREQYFTTGIVHKIAVNNYGSFDTRVINWSAVRGGGWIAWYGALVRYVPEGFGDTARTTAFSGLNSDSSAMTIEEAKAYVPQLADSDE